MDATESNAATKCSTVSEDTTLTADDAGQHIRIDTRQQPVIIKLPDILPSPVGYVFYGASCRHKRLAVLIGIVIDGEKMICKLDVCNGAATLYYHGKCRGWGLKDISGR